MTEEEREQEKIFVGVDVCKRWLDIAAGADGAVQRIANDPSSWARWIAEQGAPSRLHVIVEATGGFERCVTEGCHAAGVAYSLENPLRVRRFAQALGCSAKTDALDAKVLAKYGEAMRPREHVPLSAERAELRDLVNRRHDLLTMRTAEKNRLTQADGAIRANVERHIEWLDSEAQKLEQEIERCISESSEMAATASRLRSVKGVGPVTVATLLALLPELVTWNRSPCLNSRLSKPLALLPPGPK